MQSDAINKFAILMNIQWAFVDLLLQVAGEIGKERHAVLSFLQKSCSTLQLRILVHVITWCFCMLSVPSICSIWLLFKKAIPWLPQDDYDKLALQYLSYARCLILDAFLWLSEWWTVINLRTTFCQDLGAHCPRIFHLLFEVWVPQGHCCEPWLQLEVSIDRSSTNGH